MNQVCKISELGKSLQIFNAHTIDEAVGAAEKYADLHGVNIGNYFIQHKIGRSQNIIVTLEPILKPVPNIFEKEKEKK